MTLARTNKIARRIKFQIDMYQFELYLIYWLKIPFGAWAKTCLLWSMNSRCMPHANTLRHVTSYLTIAWLINLFSAIMIF